MSDKVKVSCILCGATNNYPQNAAGKKVVCGKCHNALPVPGDVLEIPPDKADILIHQAGLPVLADFYSPTCAPCLAMHPVVERLAKRKAGELMVLRLNVDLMPDVAASLGIHGVPTFVIFSRGSERGRVTGAMPETDLSLWVASRM
jgi:thioredoxin 2